MKIFVQYTDTKFANSIVDIKGEFSIASGVLNNNLFDIQNMYNFDTYIFCANLFNLEIYQFIEDYQQIKNIIFYHPTINSQILNISNRIKHISSVEQDGCIKIPNCINTHVFYKKECERNSKTVCFLDAYTELPQQINKLLYPDNRVLLQIFSKNIKHQQNFGYLTESDKAQLLNISDSYLNLDNEYLIEAKLCGVKVLEINTNGDISHNISDIPKYTTYKEFLESVVI